MGGPPPGRVAGSCPQLSLVPGTGGTGLPDGLLGSQGSSEAEREGFVHPERHR